MPHIKKNITNQAAKQLLKTSTLNPFTKIWSETAEESWNEPDGATAVSGPTEFIVSGFGLRVEGIVGMDDPAGECAVLPGDGKRGAISGDNSVYGESGGFGSTAGAAEIVGVSKFIWAEGIDSAKNRITVMAGARKLE